MKESLTIGKRYKGEGSSGLTDGVWIEGVLIEKNDYWYSILRRDDGMECAVHSSSLTPIQEQTQQQST